MILQCRGVDDPNAAAEPSRSDPRPAGPLGGAAVADHPVRRRGDLDPRPLRRPGRQGALSGMTPFPGKETARPPTSTALLHPPDAVRRAPRARSTRPATPRTCRPRPPSARRSRPPRSRRSPTPTAPGRSSSRCAATSRTSPSAAATRWPARSWSSRSSGISCDQPSDPPTTADTRAARAAGSRRAPATSPARASTRPSPRRSGGRRRTGSNRFSIPITFGLPPDACDVLDPRPPTGFYGSELMAQAALQWAPAYCLDKKRFKFQLNQMSDEAGWNLMESGGGAGRVGLLAHERRASDPVGYAPTAVTGFAIGYVIDRPDNAGEYTELRLNAAAAGQAAHPVLPGLRPRPRPPGHRRQPARAHERPRVHRSSTRGSARPRRRPAPTLLSLSNVLRRHPAAHRLHRQDKDAMAFIDGKADPWGMKVNPATRASSCRRPSGRSWTPTSRRPTNACRQDNPAVYFTQLAAPVTTLRKIAEALLDALAQRADPVRLRPGHATPTSWAGSTGRATGRASCSASSASATPQRYGLRIAALETKARTRTSRRATARLGARPCELTDADRPMTTAVRARPGRRAQVGTAYPGTMVVYTAARLANLDQADADKVAQFIRVATTEGQKTGTGNGELPPGYLPIEDKGVTAKLYDSAQEVADRGRGADAAAQRGPTPTSAPARRGADTCPRAAGPAPPAVGARARRCRAERTPHRSCERRRAATVACRTGAVAPGHAAHRAGQLRPGDRPAAGAARARTRSPCGAAGPPAALSGPAHDGDHAPTARPP